MLIFCSFLGFEVFLDFLVFDSFGVEFGLVHFVAFSFDEFDSGVEFQLFRVLFQKGNQVGSVAFGWDGFQGKAAPGAGNEAQGVEHEIEEVFRRPKEAPFDGLF